MKKSKKSKSVKPMVVPAEQLADRPPLENRLADLRWVPGLVARIRRIGSGGNDLAGGVYPARTLDPIFFDEMIREEHGGGIYEMRFHIGKKPLLLANGELETYVFGVAGEPKVRKEEEKSDLQLILDEVIDLMKIMKR